MYSQTDTFILPSGYKRIKVVDSFDELVGSTFGPKVNAICWSRTLIGDFDEVAAGLGHEREVDEERMKDIQKGLSPLGRLAVDVMLEDQRLLQEHGLLPSLECAPHYRPDNISAVIPTDIYSFHADRAPVPVDTYLCSYNQAATEGLRNDMGQRRIDIPETRAALRKHFEQEEGGHDDGDFDGWLRENCYDLHYVPQAGAVPFSFGIGNLWRIAIEYPGCPVPPCLHRAPKTMQESLPRLLLIS